jgi:hypothetical protein
MIATFSSSWDMPWKLSLNLLQFAWLHPDPPLETVAWLQPVTGSHFCNLFFPLGQILLIATYPSSWDRYYCTNFSLSKFPWDRYPDCHLFLILGHLIQFWRLLIRLVQVILIATCLTSYASLFKLTPSAPYTVKIHIGIGQIQALTMAVTDQTL